MQTRITQLMGLLSMVTLFTGCSLSPNKTSKNNVPEKTVVNRKLTKKKQVQKSENDQKPVNHSLKKRSKVQKPVKRTVPAMNFEQIKNGDYTSLMGKWKLVANAYNTYHGEGVQWHKLEAENRSQTLVITKKEIRFNQDVVFHGKTMREPNDGKIKRKLKFHKLKGCLSGDSDGAIFWSIEFWPKNVPLGNVNELHEDHPAAIDVSKDRIWIFTSNMGHTSVFLRVD